MPKSPKSPKTKQPTHDEIAHRAHQLWKERGGHHGNDQEHWLDAEQQLKARLALEADENHGHTPDPHEHSANGNSNGQAEQPSPEPHKEEVRAEQQKQAARAPQVPHHTGPAPKPPVSGKPIYPKAHSS